MKIVLSVLFWIVTAVMSILVFLSVLSLEIFLFPFDRKRKIAHTQGFWWADAIIGLTPLWGLTISGLEQVDPKKTYVVVANHQGFADIVMLYKTRMQFKWVAKESLFKIPVFGWCMSLMKHIKLRRGEYGSIKGAYQQAAEWLRQGVSVVFFPEGTRSAIEQMNNFKNGAFKLAIKEKKPILPIRIEGSRNIIPRGSWILQGKAYCRLTILPEIDTSNYAPQDFVILREKTRAALTTSN